ncbi:rhodanese-like domain-containing protein [Algisphaera agarilytica]|uniref:Adenylyltransferase/sulfurtransferase n=1 Tax=Algisphaera agarilytica TaxID=1385975 RepID=A0A7X0LKL8_9BACT|nr:rhodanese-like domain-containing protein [Algisphaera agarilytica]MBB6429093.1 adenylyltransferase/sulfurtransferase [Algisphaera agarilytica]
MAERPLDSQGLPDGYTLQPDWEVTPRAVKTLREAGEDFVLLDVREPREIAAAAVDGAVVVPMGEIPSRLSELEPRAQEKIVVMCHHGVRSMRVAAFLRQQGFQDVKSMAGGIDLWSRDIDAGVPRY